MRLSTILSLAVIVGAALLVNTCEGQIWETIGALVLKEAVKLWDRGDRNLFGHKCTYRVDPKIRRFQLYFEGKITCPTLSNVRGEHLTRSRSSVLAKTVSDYVKKILEKGVITEEEARAFINK